MQILLLGIGVVLIAVGLAFAVAGVGLDRAQGGARGGTLEAPAWLFLVVIGVGLMIFSATRDWNGDVSVTPTVVSTTTATTQAPATSQTTTGAPGTTDAPTTTPGPTTTTTPVTTGASGCQVTIANPLASIRAQPDTFSRELTRVPAGTYAVREAQDGEFVSVQRWYLIDVDGQAGWIMDSTFNIASKAGCG